MKKIQISKYQFFIILWSFMFANDITRGYYGPMLKMDLMLVLPVSILLSVVIFFLYSFIYKNNQWVDFTEAIENIAGKFFSKLLFILYSIYFILKIFFYVRNISELIQIILIEAGKIYLIGAGILLVILYVVHHGVEVFARYNTYNFVVSFGAFLFFFILLFVANEPDYHNLLPFLEKGVKPLIKPTLEMAYAIPFGEMFVMLIFFQYVKNRRKSYKWSYIGIIFTGIFMLSITFFNLIFLGSEAMSVGYSPTLRIMRRVDVQNLIQRLDLIVLGIFMILIVTKIGVLLFISKHLLNKIVKIKKEIIITINTVIFLIIGLMFFGKSYTEIILIRFKILVPYVLLVFEIIIPFLLVAISFIRKNKGVDRTSES